MRCEKTCLTGPLEYKYRVIFILVLGVIHSTKCSWIISGRVKLLLQILIHVHHGKFLNLEPLKVHVKVPIFFVCTTKKCLSPLKPIKKKIILSRETVVLRRWDSKTRKFGFIKGVDKGRMATVKDLES